MEFKSNVATEEEPGLLLSTGKIQNHRESGQYVGLERGTAESELVLYLWNITTNKKLKTTTKGLEMCSWESRGVKKSYYSKHMY